MAGSAVEIAHIYGNDLTIGDNGDLLLSFDIYGTPYPQATLERMLRIIMTNPITFDANGNPVVPPDHLFHPFFGSGARAAIGENYTKALVNDVNNRIQQALLNYPYIIHQPPPVITWTQLKPGEYNLIISGTAITGAPFTFPAIPLSTTGAVSIIGA